MPILGTVASQFSGKSFSSFESISTVTVGSGGSGTITFSSIPATYTHLQVRGIVQTSRGTYSVDNMITRFNSDTASNYAWHYISGGYTTTPIVEAGGGGSATFMYNLHVSTSVPGTTFASVVMDILDYANTNKFKTVRTLNGFDVNGTAGTGSYGGTVTLMSGLWRSTSAITSITFAPEVGPNFAQYSQFALYGIKGA
jgi:hypothetical protein